MPGQPEPSGRSEQPAPGARPSGTPPAGPAASPAPSRGWHGGGPPVAPGPPAGIAPDLAALCLTVTGVVQGVGYRPFVHGLARRLALTGWVRNTSAGVEIAIEGHPHHLAAFVAGLGAEAPPLARIERIESRAAVPAGVRTFEILPSIEAPGQTQPVPPDVAVCADCLAEMREPRDRRYRYPFTNCTHCGPRFTLIVDLPYDRPNTTMSGFALCPDCAAEYADPTDRRFHAQPVACPACGPRLWIEPSTAGAAAALRPMQAASGGGDPASGAGRNGRLATEAALAAARRLLAAGAVVAVKGLGGFHLACNACDERAVAGLRRRKHREAKPLAVMLRDLATVARHCECGPAEVELLGAPASPIVLLRRRPGSTIALAVAPDSAEIGVMLPYTPLHHLLLEPGPDAVEALVMTSGNLSDEPIATDNQDARDRLGPMCDALLMHDRPIRTRCDDSVTRVFAGTPYFLRRSRGYAPYPVVLPRPMPPLLAVGAELKNVFALTRGASAFLSHHIGDMENLQTLQAFEDGVRHLERLMRISPEALAHDLHPDYLSTRYALTRSEAAALPALAVQHHHAHVAACMADNGLDGDRPVIGVAFDGAGLGTDGAIWGGEILLADYRRCERRLHLGYVPLPGGDRAAREPWRMALAWLRCACIDWEVDLPSVAAAPSAEALAVLRRQMEVGLNSPPTSSMGRLFDAAASLAGLRHRSRFEAEAAMALEAAVAPDETGAYDLDVGASTIDARPLIAAMVADARAGTPIDRMAARFHNGVARAVRAACGAVRRDSSTRQVALTGGVWQNAALLARTAALLQEDGFDVLLHRQVPSNDGGLALGQALIAGHFLASGGTAEAGRGAP